MKSFKKTMACLIVALSLVACAAPRARAQDAFRLIFPEDNQQVRGEITVRYEGVPDGGYVKVSIDNKFRLATANTSFQLNTFPPNFPDDGPHQLTIIAINGDGKPVGQVLATFQIANKQVDTSSPPIFLRQWVATDRLSDTVQRYRVWAESDANIEGGAGGGGGGGAAGAGGGGAGGTSDSDDQNWIPAPLDWQVSALVRRVVRDVDMVDGAANVRSIVQEAAQRQRISESGGGASGTGGAGGAMGAGGPGTTTKHHKKKKKGPSGPTKAPWEWPDNRDGAHNWHVAPELGLYFVKMIKQTGEEINATRKSPPVALGDLLPTFPEEEVHPGSTWDTTMTFMTELSTRSPLNVHFPITFTAFENIKTPAGESRKTAKLESRFSLASDDAKKVALKILAKSGVSGAGQANPVAGGNATAADEFDLDDIDTATCRISRVLWFDIENRRVLRSEDIINTYFETAEDSDASVGGSSGGDSGEGSSRKVSYSLRVITWYDDTLPPPTIVHNFGAGTAHGRAPGTRDQSPVEDPRYTPLTQSK